MAREKAKSPAELFREELDKRKTEGRPQKERPTVFFPNTTLQLVRTKCKLKMAQVADKLGLEPQQVSDAEKGRNVRLNVAVTLAAFYGKTVEELFSKPEVRQHNPSCDKDLGGEVSQNETSGNDPGTGDMYETAEA